MYKKPSPQAVKPLGRDMFVAKAERCRGGQQLSFGKGFYLGRNLEVSQVLDFKQDKEFNGGKEKVSKQIFSFW